MIKDHYKFVVIFNDPTWIQVAKSNSMFVQKKHFYKIVKTVIKDKMTLEKQYQDNLLPRYLPKKNNIINAKKGRKTHNIKWLGI